MNIAVIYDKYDLRGKVRVSFRKKIWYISIAGYGSIGLTPNLTNALNMYITSYAAQARLRKIEYRNGTGERA